MLFVDLLKIHFKIFFKIIRATYLRTLKKAALFFKIKIIAFLII